MIFLVLTRTIFDPIFLNPGESGRPVGQDHPEGRERQVGVQVHEHQVLLLGRRQRTQVILVLLFSK